MHIDQIRENATELPLDVHLYQSLPKGDKMDYIVQKAVELGVTSVTPVAGAEKKIARWQKIAEEAAKQCGRGIVPHIHMPVSFARAIEEGKSCDLPLFCYEGDGTRSLRDILSASEADVRAAGSANRRYSSAVYIGPEGGYDTKEVALAQDAGFTPINLGRRILRCETASGFVLAAFTYAFEL